MIMQKMFKSQKMRFGLAGLINTITDISLLNFLVTVAGIPLVVSNTVSTTFAMAISFFLNKEVVFRGSKPTKRQIILFIAVTATGLWIVQTAAVVGAYSLLGSFQDELRLNIAKVIGIMFSLTWNYIWYSKAVFNRD